MKKDAIMTDKKLRIVSTAIYISAALHVMNGISNLGGYGMDGMGMAETIKFITEIGITPLLLVFFVRFFISRSKDDDNKVKEAYKTAQENMESNNRAVREREDFLMAESAKREEIIRQEAERREKLIRQEAEKRENILMASQERMLDTLEGISGSLNKIEEAFTRLEVSVSARLDDIERKLENGCNKGS